GSSCLRRPRNLEAAHVTAFAVFTITNFVAPDDHARAPDARARSIGTHSRSPLATTRRVATKRRDQTPLTHSRPDHTTATAHPSRTRICQVPSGNSTPRSPPTNRFNAS